MVAPIVEVGIAAGLFRTHVVGSPDQHTGAGQPGSAVGVIDGLGDPEVHQLDSARFTLEHDVLGFDVPMDDAGFMGRAEGIRGLEEDAGSLPNRSRPLPHQQRPKALALDQRHQNVGDAFRLADVVNRDDMRMPQRRDRFGFTPEPGQQGLGNHQIRPKGLQREVSLQPPVVDQKHFGKATPADQLAEVVVATEDALKPVEIRGRNSI